MLQHPDCPADLDLVCLGANAAGLFAVPEETCYRAVRAVPAGWTLTARGAARPRLHQHWRVPEIDRGRVPPFDAAAEELRDLLGRAVSERCAVDGPTVLWLSGGYDSSAIFGVGSRALTREADGRTLQPISVSFPPDDPGREDDLISEIAAYWNAPVRWLHLDAIPLLDRAAERAACYDEPYVHFFPGWVRTLMRETRASGARVALYGDGGDQLFAVSDIYLADLFRQGRWLRLAREWRALGRAGYRTFYHDAVEPVLPAWVTAGLAAARGREAPPPYLEPSVPEWIDRRFVREHNLVERERRHAPRLRGATLATSETYRSLTHALMPRVASELGASSVEEGVEIRSPFYDRRVMEFVLPRPQRERASGRAVKHLLRRAMRDVLPERVLEPRKVRTGTLLRYFSRSTRETYATEFEEAFDNPVLAELGIVDPGALKRSWEDYRSSGRTDTGATLFFTLQVELWLRARLRPGQASSVGAPEKRPKAVAS